MSRQRLLRWAAGIAAVIGALVPAVVLVTPAVASPVASVAPANPVVSVTATNQVNTPGSQWLASCLASGRTLSVLFVLDVSGSLLQSDPAQFRYEGLRTALTTLANASPADGSDVTIEAAVAAFGDQWYAPGDIVPWQKINIDGPDVLIDTMVSQTRDQTAWRQDWTAFQSVVSNATHELTSRGGAESCRAVVWFTDGDPSDPEAIPGMCSVGGVVDQMRNEGIVLIGLRLLPPGVELISSAMQTMTLGEWDGQSCGTVPIPESAAPGIFLDATEVKRLFASIQNIVEGCTLTSGATIDPGIRRVRVNIYAGVPSVKFDLPDGISFTAGTSGNSGPFDGVHVASVMEDFYVSMQLSLPEGVGAGEWLVSSTVPLDAADVEFCVFSDLHLELDQDSMLQLEAGVPGVLTVHVLGPDGAPADLDDYETISTAASLVGPDGAPRTVEASMNPNGHDIDLLVRTDPSDARLDLSVTLNLTTQSGIALTPLKLDTAVITALNEYYPKVTPLDVLDLGVALREDSTSAMLTLVGSEKGPTSVCVDAPIGLSVPPDAADADPVYAIGCIELAPGETRTLTVSASTTNAVEGDGAAQIPIKLHAAPDTSGHVGEAGLNLPVEWRFSNPLNVGVLIWALLAVIAGAVIIPLAAILWANWVTARFDVTDLLFERIDVRVDSRDVSRRTPLKGGSDGLVGLVRDAGVRGRRSIFFPRRRLIRRFELEGIVFRAKASWNPFRPPLFWAESPDGTVLLTTFSAAAGLRGAPNTARVAPAFDAAVLLVADPASIGSDGTANATAIALVSSVRFSAEATAAVRRAGWPGRLASHRIAGGAAAGQPGGGSDARGRGRGRGPAAPPPTPGDGPREPRRRRGGN